MYIICIHATHTHIYIYIIYIYPRFTEKGRRSFGSLINVLVLARCWSEFLFVTRVRVPPSSSCGGFFHQPSLLIVPACNEAWEETWAFCPMRRGLGMWRLALRGYDECPRTVVRKGETPKMLDLQEINIGHFIPPLPASLETQRSQTWCSKYGQHQWYIPTTVRNFPIKPTLQSQ